MKKSELTKLRKLVNEEIERRKELNALIENEFVKKYIELSGIPEKEMDSNNIRDILENLLRNFKVTETNGVYVCTEAYDQDFRAPVIYYREPETYDEPDNKRYKDIESGEKVCCGIGEGLKIDDFERTHIVLNPYNRRYNDVANGLCLENGYDDVRYDFFEESYRHGQYVALQKILKKYPRMGSWR